MAACNSFPPTAPKRSNAAVTLPDLVDQPLVVDLHEDHRRFLGARVDRRRGSTRQCRRVDVRRRIVHDDGRGDATVAQHRDVQHVEQCGPLRFWQRLLRLRRHLRERRRHPLRECLLQVAIAEECQPPQRINGVRAGDHLFGCLDDLALRLAIDRGIGRRREWLTWWRRVCTGRRP